jgi:phosphatidylinositol-bisphosphatase
MRKQDALENETMPDVAVSANEVDFGSVHYMTPQSRKLIVKNTGQVPAKWAFVAKPGESRVFRPWLQVAPEAGVLQPGEQVAILLAASIDRITAPMLCAGSDKLDDMLVLQLESGKKIFVQLAGRYMRSCFGMTLGLLARYPLPVRTSGPAAGRRLRIPKELWRLVDHLLHHGGMDEPDLFLQTTAGSIGSEVEAVRECLDTGESFALSDFGIHAVAAAMLAFLENLSVSVVPPSIFQRLVAATQPECRAIVNEVLDADHYATFYYVLAFLRELLRHSEKNHMTPERLAVVFSGVLLRSPDPALDSDPATRERADFVIYRFLTDDPAAKKTALSPSPSSSSPKR